MTKRWLSCNRPTSKILTTCTVCARPIKEKATLRRQRPFARRQRASILCRKLILPLSERRPERCEQKVVFGLWFLVFAFGHTLSLGRDQKQLTAIQGLRPKS